MFTYACFAIFLNLTDTTPVYTYCAVGNWAPIERQCNQETDACEIILDPRQGIPFVTYEYTVNGGRDASLEEKIGTVEENYWPMTRSSL